MNPYCHLVGDNKKAPLHCDLVCFYLKSEFPEYYERVLKLAARAYGETAVKGHNESFEPFYQYYSNIYERIKDYSLEQILNVPFRLSKHYEEQSRLCGSIRQVSSGDNQSWQRILPFFRKANTGEALLKRFAWKSDTENGLDGRLKAHIANFLITNLVNERYLELG